MQILIQLSDENVIDTLEKVKNNLLEGYRIHKSDPKYRIIENYEELPISDEDIANYNKQKSLERIQEILSRGSYD